jgi:hypothetical protein
MSPTAPGVDPASIALPPTEPIDLTELIAQGLDAH